MVELLLTAFAAMLAFASERAARSWTRRSVLRLPLDLVTCGAMLVALVQAARLT